MNGFKNSPSCHPCGPMDFLSYMIAERNCSCKRHTYLVSIFYFPQQNLGGPRLWTTVGKWSHSLEVWKPLWDSSATTWQHQRIRHCPNTIVVSSRADVQYFPFISLPLFSPFFSLPARNQTSLDSSSKSWLLESPRDFREKQSWPRVRARGRPGKGTMSGCWEQLELRREKSSLANEERMCLSLQEARNFDFPPASANKCLLERTEWWWWQVTLVWILWNFSCLFYLLKEKINVQIPQLTILNSACVFIGEVSVVPQSYF